VGRATEAIATPVTTVVRRDERDEHGDERYFVEAVPLGLHRLR
jgi:hypothetical protein